jgi:hypothetical protein
MLTEEYLFDDTLFEEDDSYLFDVYGPQEPIHYQVTSVPEVPCFLKSTHILTIKGEKKIEDLTKGDYIRCYDGRLIQVIDIYSFVCNHDQNLPYKIPRNTKINNRICNKDLYLSPLHAVLVGNTFIAIKYLNFKQTKRSDHTDAITYYHIVLPNYYTDAIIANGIVCEGLNTDPDKYQVRRRILIPRIKRMPLHLHN